MTEQIPPNGPPPEEKGKAQTFDQAALARMRAAASEVLAVHPEVRSVIVVLDYKGPLNDAPIDKALWIGENGAVTGLDAMFGSAANLMRVMQHVFGSIDQRGQAMREEAQVLGNELVKRRQQLEQHTKSTKAAVAPDGDVGKRPPTFYRDPNKEWPNTIWVNKDGSGRVIVPDGSLTVLAVNVTEDQIRRFGYDLVKDDSNNWREWKRPDDWRPVAD
jgi:hypothetical protein